MIGSSSKNGGSTLPTMTPKAFEAELIQKATQTAIVAARSILMSGGTEESALKTAKTAAESVLNPAGSESGSVSASSIGNAFSGRKRKAKRQAEVVASMALMSATSLQPSGGTPMGRNIVTVKQDEPSVLSGSTRPPKTPGSTVSRSSFQALPEVKEETEARDPAPEQNSMNFAPPPVLPTSPQNAVMSPNHAVASGYNSFLSATDDDTESNLFGINDSTAVDSSRLEESTLYDETDDDTTFILETLRRGKRSSRSESKDSSRWNLESLINQLQELDLSKLDLSKLDLSKMDLSKFNLNQFNLNQFNLNKFNLDMMKCGEGGFLGPRSSSRGRDRRRSGRRSERNHRGRNRSRSRSRARETSIADSRDDTFGDETTAFSPASTPKKEREMYKDSDFPNSYDSDTCHSDILSTDFSEENVKFRNSIRETMGNMASKSALVRNKLNMSATQQPKRSRSFFRKKRLSATQRPKRSRSFFRKKR